MTYYETMKVRERDDEIYFLFFLIILFSHFLNHSIITRLLSAATLFKEEGFFISCSLITDY